MVEPRGLSFGRIDEVMPEVERLLAGHSTCGSWTLGQILHHLATAVELSVQAGEIPVANDPGPDADRVFKVRRRLFFRAGRFPVGLEPPLAALLPPKDVDPRVEANRLREALVLLESTRGPFPDHPILGTMTREEWEMFHRFHCAHHLGFARVESDRSGGR